MKYLAIVLASSLAACASHSAPNAESADSVQAANNTPSQVEIAPVDAHWPRTSATDNFVAGNAIALPGPSTRTPDEADSTSDGRVTQSIRAAVVADASLSVMAKNVKIITIDGKVTLRGVVKTDDERMRIAAAAKRVAGDDRVENFLEVDRK